MTDHSRIVRHIPIIWEGESPPDFPEFPPALEIGAQAASSAILGGINGMMREGMANMEEFREGRIDQKQFTYRVIRKGSETAVQYGSKAVAALTMRQGLIYAAKKIGARKFLTAARSHAMVSVCYGVVDQGMDTFKYYRGDLDATQYKVQTSQNVGSTGGAIGGAAIGAVIGSAVPGVGTVFGAMMGMLGAASGASIGKSVGEKMFAEEASPDEGDPQEK